MNNMLEDNSSIVDNFPDIDNTYLEVDQIISWIDSLVEANNNEKDTCNK